jgi:hypothetical protein
MNKKKHLILPFVLLVLEDLRYYYHSNFVNNLVNTVQSRTSGPVKDAKSQLFCEPGEGI